MARKKLRSETLRHREALNYYYLLGEKRNLQAVARTFRVSKQAVGDWSVAFNWRDRVLLRDLSNAQALEERTDLNIQEAKAEILKMLYSKISSWDEVFFGKNVSEEIKKKKISEFTPSDICNFIKLIFSLTENDEPPAKTRQHFTDPQLEAIISGEALVSFPGCYGHLSNEDLDEVTRLTKQIFALTKVKGEDPDGQEAGSIQ